MKTVTEILLPARTPPQIALAASRLAWYAASFRLSASARTWQACSTASAVIAVMAVIVYIVAVNAILLSGEAIRREATELNTLERKNRTLANALVERQSPSWLELSARGGGMVTAGNVRYLARDQAVALSGNR